MFRKFDYEPYSEREFRKPAWDSESSPAFSGADSYGEPAAGSSPDREKKRNEKTRRAILIAAALIAAMIVSGAAGIGGAYWILSGNTGAYSRIQRPVAVAQNSAAAVNTATGGYNDVVEIVKKTADSVVEISTEITQFSPFSGQFVQSGAGSGVILTPDGYIVTNNHVIKDAENITARMNDGREYKAALIGTDEQTDLAVLKISANDLHAATFADSSSIEVGQTAVVIGNPLGRLGGTVTSGIISARDREITIDSETMRLLQTSAAVNRGNSGGGLFDSDGNLVGIVNAKSSGADIEGLGFAIPSNTVAEIADQIMSNGYVTGRPQIGVKVVEISDAWTAARYGLSSMGVYITESSNSALMAGDRIMSIDGTEIQSNEDLRAAVRSHKVGDTLPIKISRGDQELVLNVKLTEQVPETVSPPSAA
jgi:serine protease Do